MRLPVVSIILGPGSFSDPRQESATARRCTGHSIIRFLTVPCVSGGSVVKNLPAKAGDTADASSIPGLGRSPGGGNGNPLQPSCLENSTDRGAWWATVQGGCKESDTTE